MGATRTPVRAERHCATPLRSSEASRRRKSSNNHKSRNNPGGAATPENAGLAVAVSGGSDSMGLLWVTWQHASAAGLKTWALHVHHGLQPVADTWPARIEAELRRWADLHPDREPIALKVQRLSGAPLPGQSVQEWARVERYRVLCRLARGLGLDLLLLAHHRQDQAETFLLQALRGAGPQGLAAMPALRWQDGVCMARPWLQQERPAIRTLVTAAGLHCVDDPSNGDLRWARSRLRQEVWPALADAFESASASLARSAQRCAEALWALREHSMADLAALMPEWTETTGSAALDLTVWQALSQSRRAWALRTWFELQGLQAPSNLVDRLAAHDLASSPAARWPIERGSEVRWYRGRLCLAWGGGEGSARAPALTGDGAIRPALELVLRRSGRRRLPGWSGCLVLRRAEPDEPGLPHRLPLALTVRPRVGTDRFALAPAGTPRELKKQFQARAVPAWERGGPVLTQSGGAIVFVAGLGLDARVATRQGRWTIDWEPDALAG